MATFPPTVSPVPTVSPMPNVSLLPTVNITEVAQEVIEKPNRETDPACRVWFLRGSCVRAYPEEQPTEIERNIAITGIFFTCPIILLILLLTVNLSRTIETRIRGYARDGFAESWKAGDLVEKDGKTWTGADRADENTCHLSH